MTMDQKTGASPEDRQTAAVEMRGVRAGAIVLVGIAAANLGNYVFHLLTARSLGPSDYGDVVVLLTLSGLVALPLGGVQVVVARATARAYTQGRGDLVRALVRRSLASALLVATALALALFVLVRVWSEQLGVETATAAALAALLVIPAGATPILWGLVQGLQQFTLLAMAMILGTLARLVVLGVLMLSGLSASSAITATVVGGVVAALVPLLRSTEWLRAPAAPVSLPTRRTQLRPLWPVLLGVLAFTSLTTCDVIAAKIVFDETTAGVYGAASLMGRIILYLPAAIVTVLLPKVSARSALRRASSDILGFSLLATLLFCAVALVAYTLFPSIIVDVAYGASFADAAELLWLFAVTMTCYALINVLLFYHLGRHESRLSWLLVAAAIVQPAVFLIAHSSPTTLLWADMAIAIAIVVLHEFVFRGALIAALASAMTALRGPRR